MHDSFRLQFCIVKKCILQLLLHLMASQELPEMNKDDKSIDWLKTR